MNTEQKLLLHFLKSQKLLVLASIDNDQMPHITNLFMGVDTDFKIYFVSNENTEHSKHIEDNPNIAFSTVWFDEEDHTNRKGIQGKGVCRIADSEEEIAKGVKLHNEKYPDFKEKITVNWIKDNTNDSHVWIIEPSYIKYWDDENFRDKTVEISF